MGQGDAHLVETLLGWWSTARVQRDRLAWRQTRDPWAVLVSEMMLVQTQVSRVEERFPAILARFPRPAACAEAPVGEVIRLWAGLGYNRRAIWLHSAARQIVEGHAGRVPDSLPALLALPGVGAYTARAVLAFAYGQCQGVVDTNVGRVLARAFEGRCLSSTEAQAKADDLVPPRLSREWNLAVMDFGSLLCTARSPACGPCPLVSGHCAWRRRPELGDPAVGSAGVGRAQSAFQGSDREGRGRLVRAACAGPLSREDLAAIAGWPDNSSRAERVVAALVREGLLVEDGATRAMRLPSNEPIVAPFRAGPARSSWIGPVSPTVADRPLGSANAD